MLTSATHPESETANWIPPRGTVRTRRDGWDLDNKGIEAMIPAEVLRSHSRDFAARSLAEVVERHWTV